MPGIRESLWCYILHFIVAPFRGHSHFVFVGFIHSTGEKFILSNAIASGLSHFVIIWTIFFQCHVVIPMGYHRR